MRQPFPCIERDDGVALVASILIERWNMRHLGNLKERNKICAVQV